MKEKSKFKKISMIILIIILIILSSSIVYGVKENTAAYVWYCKNEIPVKTTKVALDELYARANQSGNASEIASDRLNIGKTVKGYKPYTKAAGGTSDEWQIMYADANHVYIITKYKVYNTTGSDLTLSPAGDTNNGSLKDYYEGGNTLFKNYRAVNAGWLEKYMESDYAASYSEGNWSNKNNDSNMRCLAYMLDSGQWNKDYLVPGKADWAIGGPTMEMLRLSYDTFHGQETDWEAIAIAFKNKATEQKELLTQHGYCYGFSADEYLTNNEDTWWNHGEDYFLASPDKLANGSNLLFHVPIQRIAGCSYTSPRGFRPVVCLSSRVVLDWDPTNLVYWVK